VKYIVKFVAYTQNNLNVCRLWNVVIVVGLLDILVNFVELLEVRTCFPQIYVLSKGGRALPWDIQNCNFLPDLPLKFVFH